jgi:multidrug efflux pump subunit AcrA (membrane-fusion protein)
MKKTVISFVILFLLAGCGSPQTPSVSIPAVKDTQTLKAKAKLIPVQNAELGFTGSGTVSEVRAHEGDQVKKGDVLVCLEGSEEVQAALAAAELELVSARQDLQNLTENSAVDAADIEMKLAKARVDLDDAVKAREKLGWKRADQLQIDALEAEKMIAKQALDDAETIYNYIYPYNDAESATRAQVLIMLSDARKRYEQAVSKLNYANSKPKESELAEADALVAQLETQVAYYEDEFQRVKDAADPRKVELAQARVDHAEAQVQAAREKLTNLQIIAPFAGVVVDNPLKVGEIVIPASTVKLGDLTTWRLETTNLKESAIRKLQAGMPVVVKFDAVPGLELKGEVERLKIIGEKVYGDVYYTTYIQLLENDPRLLWNMTAEVYFDATPPGDA